MIHYALKCASDHAYDSWFQSAAAFDVLAAAGHVACPVCGSTGVEKSLMAPAVRPARAGLRPDRPAADQSRNDANALAALRRRIETTADYVGPDFASEARRIHLGDAPERAIYGEARPDEARSLIEDGVPVAPLPFIPARKAN